MADTKRGNPPDRLEDEGGSSSDRQRIHNSPPGAGTPSGFPNTPMQNSKEGVLVDRELAGHGSGKQRVRTDWTPLPPGPDGPPGPPGEED